MDIFHKLRQHEKITSKAADEALRLKRLAKHQKRLHKNLNMHFATVEMIRQFEHEGRLYLEESGIDCDCVQYAGTIHEIEASPYALRKLEEEISRWADGTFSLQPLRFEDVEDIRCVTRDLAAEAFEDGHQHAVYSFIPV
jgi:hypothetical protein